jgi:hypothetical protein|tara:strand:- start:82 stop:216 length:135 start_codon:yes stop_codon:yes gene_type:complete
VLAPLDNGLKIMTQAKLMVSIVFARIFMADPLLYSSSKGKRMDL